MELANLENNIEMTVRLWIESMRASSPINIHREAMHSLVGQDYHSWMLRHPSALLMFEQITKSAQGKQIAMFLDYDGTLAPITNDPELAIISHAMRATVREVASFFPTAIVSGRLRDKVYNFVGLEELYYAGSHGMDIKGPSKGSNYIQSAQSVFRQPANEFISMIDEVYHVLVEKTKSTPGTLVENNKFCLCVHFRCVEDKRWSGLALEVLAVLKNYPKLQVEPGRKVLNIRPDIKWDKGRALQFLLESLGYANRADVFPIFIGDDRTDEDAFTVLRDRGQGSGILVTKMPKNTKASYSLRDPSEVMDFLQKLVQWKRENL